MKLLLKLSKVILSLIGVGIIFPTILLRFIPDFLTPELNLLLISLLTLTLVSLWARKLKLWVQLLGFISIILWLSLSGFLYIGVGQTIVISQLESSGKISYPVNNQDPPLLSPLSYQLRIKTCFGSLLECVNFSPTSLYKVYLNYFGYKIQVIPSGNFEFKSDCEGFFLKKGRYILRHQESNCQKSSITSTIRKSCSDPSLNQREAINCYFSKTDELKQKLTEWLQMVDKQCTSTSKSEVQKTGCINSFYQRRINEFKALEKKSEDQTLLKVINKIRFLYDISDEQVYYQYKTTDLNGDGRQEYLINLREGDQCKKDNCALYVYSEDENKFINLFATFPNSRRPIYVLTTIHNGWHDIGVTMINEHDETYLSIYRYLENSYGFSTYSEDSRERRRTPPHPNEILYAYPEENMKEVFSSKE